MKNENLIQIRLFLHNAVLKLTSSGKNKNEIFAWKESLNPVQRWHSDQVMVFEKQGKNKNSFSFWLFFCFQIELPSRNQKNQRTPFVSCAGRWLVLRFTRYHSLPFGSFFFPSLNGFLKRNKRQGYFDNKLNEFHDESDELDTFFRCSSRVTRPAARDLSGPLVVLEE